MMENSEIRKINKIINAQSTDIQTKKSCATGSRVISFRVSGEQYEQIRSQCFTVTGEQLLTLTEFVRQSVLTQRIVRPIENSLDRYRMSVAAEMAVGVTNIVQVLDEFMDLADENLAMQELILIIHNLEAIQDKATQLLAPFAENLH